MNGHPSPGFSPRQTFVSARHASCTKLPLCSRCPTIVNSSQIFPCSIIISVSLFLSVRHLTRFSAEKEKKENNRKMPRSPCCFPLFFPPWGQQRWIFSSIHFPSSSSKKRKKTWKAQQRPLGPAIDFFFFPGVNKRTKAFFLTFFFANFLRSRSPPPSSVIGRVIFPRFKSG